MIAVLQFILVVRFKRLLEGRRVEALSSHICVMIQTQKKTCLSSEPLDIRAFCLSFSVCDITQGSSTHRELSLAQNDQLITVHQFLIQCKQTNYCTRPFV